MIRKTVAENRRYKVRKAMETLLLEIWFEARHLSWLNIIFHSFSANYIYFLDCKD